MSHQGEMSNKQHRNSKGRYGLQKEELEKYKYVDII